jgi:uncharacterized protein YchJ
MTSQIDLYAICPCGSDKKIKFCCPRELLADYEKLYQLIESNQRAAAVELCDRVLKQHPTQSCFLVAKATDLLAMGEFEGVRAVQQQMAQSHPDNSVTHALAVFMSLVDGDIDAAIHQLQDALDCVKESLPPLVQGAMPEVIAGLATTGSIYAALGMANVYVSLLGEAAREDIVQLLTEIRYDSNNPVVFKEAWQRNLEREFDLPAGHPLFELLPRCRWRAARDLAETWLQENPQSSLGLAVSAVMHGWLDEDDKAAERFRRLADAADISEMLAVVARVMAHALDPFHDAPPVTRLKLTFPAGDFERAMELALSHPRAQSLPGDMRAFVPEGEPPPRAVFHLLDKPMTENAADAQLADIASIEATALLFGKQTDSDARVEVVVNLVGDKPVPAVVADIFGESIGSEAARETIDQADGLLAGLHGGLLFPRNTLPDDMERLRQDMLGQMICQVWPDQPHGFLNGKSPREASQDAALQRRLLAALLHLESTPPFDSWIGDFQRVWRELGLQHTVDDVQADTAGPFWILELLRCNPEKLESRRLQEHGMLVAVTGLRAASDRFARELLKRTPAESEHGFIVLSSLQRTVWSNELKLELIRALIGWCRQHRHSPGPIRLMELRQLLQMNRPQEAQATLATLTTQHRNEPQVMQQLYMLLQQIGAIGPDGRMRADEPEAPQPPADEPGKLWTPDQPAADQPGKSGGKLWLPGMD